MKVLIVSNLYYPNGIGGAEKVAKSLAEGLLARGHEPVVATLSPDKKRKVEQVNGVRVHYVPLKNFYAPGGPKQRTTLAKILWHAVDSYNPFMAAALGRILDAERPDVVNTHNVAGFSSAAWKVAKERGLPLVHTAHDQYALCIKSSMCRGGINCVKPCADCRIYSRPRRKLSRLVDVLTAPSQFVLDSQVAHQVFPTAEKVAVYNSCNLPRGTGNSANGKGGPLRFGFLGQLTPIKGIELLIRSFLDLPAGQAELVIAGHGAPEFERQIKALAGGHPGIYWLGFVQPTELLSQVHVVVVPSLWHDSAPLVITECMAQCVPLIGSSLGGIRELMGEGTGWVFNPTEPGALTQAMRHAIVSRGELAAMGERAGVRARMFTTEVMVSGYVGAFLRAINKAAQRPENGSDRQGNERVA